MQTSPFSCNEKLHLNCPAKETRQRIQSGSYHLSVIYYLFKLIILWNSPRLNVLFTRPSLLRPFGVDGCSGDSVSPDFTGKFFVRICAKQAPREPLNDPSAGNILKAFKVTKKKRKHRTWPENIPQKIQQTQTLRHVSLSGVPKRAQGRPMTDPVWPAVTN